MLYTGDSIEIKAHTRSTDISASGTANMACFYSSSYAPIRASDLIAKVAIPHSELTGDIEVHATEAVYYQHFDDGDNVIHGHPHPWCRNGTTPVPEKRW